MSDGLRAGRWGWLGFGVGALAVACGLWLWLRATAGTVEAWRAVDEATANQVLGARPWSVPPLQPRESFVSNTNHTSHASHSGVFGPVDFEESSSSGMAGGSSRTSVRFRGSYSVECPSQGGLGTPLEYTLSTALEYRESADHGTLQFHCAVGHVPIGTTFTSPTLGLARDTAAR